MTGVGGYRYAPDVSAGPYKFVSFINQVVTLDRDPLFKGDFRGHLPTIDRVIIKRINTSLDVDLAIAGEIDLTTGVIEAAKIDKAKASAAVGETFYARNGYGYLSFTSDFGPTQDPVVRQAVAQLVDRTYVAQVVLGGYGSQVFSEYGLAQWMYVQSEEWIEEQLDLGTMNAYVYDVAAANAKLDTTEWKFEADGVTPFSAAKAATDNVGDPSTWTYFRHNAAGVKMQLNHMGSENNIVTTSLKTALPIAFAKAGIAYTVVEVPFSTLLEHYYDGWDSSVVSNRTYHMFNLATNFAVAYDPYYTWHSDWFHTDYNPYGLVDSEIDDLVVEMRSLEPTQTAEFLELWREYQLRWNFLSPTVPLYSNQYFDIYNSRVEGLQVTPFWNWSQAIVDMRLVR
jgi:peptide/nickel transport system substrate-binding protein